ncbi:MAG TPA: ABC transporter permease subunit [Thermoanaerobaculia bacterium]|nr:ABC transporter permease subunit [Thermoanaerobaculia bacterium]
MNAVVIGETMRRHLTRGGYIVYLILVALTGIFASTFNKPAAMWPSLVALLAIITGSSLIGPEFSSATLQLIVSKPIHRWTYLLSRVAGVFASVALAAIIGMSAEIGMRWLGGRAPLVWQPSVSTALNALVVAFLAVSLLALLGSVTRSYFNVAIYIGAQAALSAAEAILGVLRMRGPVGEVLQAHPWIERSIIATNDALFPSASAELGRALVLRVLVMATIALTLACLAFERREVPYGAD